MQNTTLIAPPPVVTRPSYRTSLAATAEEMAEAQALRFEVFNVELAEGLVSSFVSGRDEDPFDLVCEHLLVRENQGGKVVGTYRFQNGRNAQLNLGYYSAAEFDMGPYEGYRATMIELGRACVHKQHRNLQVLAALWRAIAEVAAKQQARYLVGCSSLSTTDTGAGLALYRQLAPRHIAPLALRTLPQPHAVCTTQKPLPAAPKPPKLLAAYLALGAWIAGPPAIDHEFGTIDFLTVLDLYQLDLKAARLFLGATWQPPFAVSADC